MRRHRPCAGNGCADAVASAEGGAKKPNILLIVSDDTGWGDLGAYLGGEARGMQTPNFDRLAREGMVFTNYLRPTELHAGPRGDPDRAHPQPQRHDHRGLPGPGRRPAARPNGRSASVLQKAGYKTYFTGKWHLGESDYALPNAQGYDEMKYAFLYHLNAYTYGDPKWFPGMSPELRGLFQKITKGAMSGKAGEAPKQDFKVNGEYVDTPDKGVVGIPYLDAYVEKAAHGVPG